MHNNTLASIGNLYCYHSWKWSNITQKLFGRLSWKFHIVFSWGAIVAVHGVGCSGFRIREIHFCCRFSTPTHRRADSVPLSISVSFVIRTDIMRPWKRYYDYRDRYFLAPQSIGHHREMIRTDECVCIEVSLGVFMYIVQAPPCHIFWTIFIFAFNQQFLDDAEKGNSNTNIMNYVKLA